jgi:tRNA pseudouridine38-40 synthase
MTRIALGLEYDGTDFVGWQIQASGRSVQGALQQAVASVAAHPVHLTAAGRTDAGVHATGQVVHFDTAASRSVREWVLGINAGLPPDVAVHWAREVDARFDARRSALARRYRYQLCESPTRPALARRCAWWVRRPLDCGAISAAASYWLGEHDFSAFRAAGCQSNTPMRRLLAVGVGRDGAFVHIEFKANAFLQHMVRNFVGVLVKIGQGDAEPRWAASVLAGRDRRAGGVAAPPWGLGLIEIEYPADYGLPQPAAGAAHALDSLTACGGQGSRE